MVAPLYVLGQLPVRNYAPVRVRDSAKDRVRSAPVDGSLERADAGFESTATDQRRPNWRFDSQSRTKPLWTHFSPIAAQSELVARLATTSFAP